MKQFFLLLSNFKKIHLNCLLLFFFLIIAYYHLSHGFSMSGDSQRFSRWADELISLNFNFYDFFSIEKDDHRPPLFFFSLPVLLIALCKIIFSNEWQFAFLLLNLLFLFFAFILFAKSLLIIGIRPIFISLSLTLIIISADILTWPRFILSDMSYAFLVIVATFFVIKGVTKNKINYLQLFLILFLLLASRPSSIPVIFSIIFFIVISKHKFFLKSKNILLFVLLIFISTPFIYGLAYLFMEYNVNSKSFDEVAYQDFIYKYVKNGMIIHGRPETWVESPNTYLDVVYIYFLRIVNFFNPYASTFSILHIILNTFQIFIVLLSIFVWSLLESNNKFQNKIYFFIIILSFFVAAFHSFILIDYDWRYRFPIILPMIMLFPMSLNIIFKKKIN